MEISLRRSLHCFSTPPPPSPSPSIEAFSSRKLSAEQMAAVSLTNKETAKILEAEAQDCGKLLPWCHLRLQSKSGHRDNL
uniref:Putative ovule protein n=1 Tax=Solanum chacoense TaxID=4108 RepID=A0A0V0HGH1_SOLCH